MGSSTSSNMASSCDAIDQKIEKMIYYPPTTDRKLFNLLNTDISSLVLLNTKSNDVVPVVLVYPNRSRIVDKYIVFSHGNGSDIYGMFELFKIWSKTYDVCVVGYDYVGYGLSKISQPSEEKCYDSMETTMEYVLSNLCSDKKKIFLIGQSLGTGMTIDYASKNAWTTPIALISPYKSICRVVVDTSLLSLVDKFKSYNKLDKIKCQIKIFHGEADDLIKISHSITIYNYLKKKSLALDPVWFKQTGHNDILQKMIAQPKYLEEILNTYTELI